MLYYTIFRFSMHGINTSLHTTHYQCCYFNENQNLKKYITGNWNKALIKYKYYIKNLNE